MNIVNKTACGINLEVIGPGRFTCGARKNGTMQLIELSVEHELFERVNLNDSDEPIRILLEIKFRSWEQAHVMKECLDHLIKFLKERESK